MTFIYEIALTCADALPPPQVKKKLEEVKAKKEASNPDDYLPDGIDRRILEAQVI